MNYEECQVIIRKVYSAFPSIKEWVTKHSPDVAATHRSWFLAIGQCTVAECESVLDSWSRGDRPPPTYQEQSQLGVTLRACVMFDRRAKAESSKPTVVDDLRKATRANYVPIMPAFSAAIAANARLAKGEISADECRRLTELAMRSIRVQSDPSEGPRYKCGLCRDKGHVEVYRTSEIEDGVSNPSMVSVACHCGSGERFANPRDRFAKMVVYRESRFCLLHEDVETWKANRSIGKTWQP